MSYKPNQRDTTRYVTLASCFDKLIGLNTGRYKEAPSHQKGPTEVVRGERRGSLGSSPQCLAVLGTSLLPPLGPKLVKHSILLAKMKHKMYRMLQKAPVGAVWHG